MASVTKTITEAVGEVQKTTTLYFSSFEDFMEYEQACSSVSERIADVTKVLSEEGGASVVGAKPTLTKLEVGKEYRVVKDISDHCHDIGSVVTVVQYDDTDIFLPYKVEDGWGDESWLKPEEVEEI